MADLFDGVVRSRQSGAAALSNTDGANVTTVDVTISAVDPGRCLVLVQPRWSSNTSAQFGGATGKLTSATNLRLQIYSATIPPGDGVVNVAAEWQVLEFN